MMQWIADAFDAKTYTIENFPLAAPLGCAISAAVKSLDISYEEAAERFVRKDSSSIRTPIPENVIIIAELVKRYRELENRYI